MPEIHKVTVQQFEDFLLSKRKVLACKSCGYEKLGVIAFSDTELCSVMSIPFSVHQEVEGQERWVDAGHGRPVFVAECGNCGCMSIYSAFTVVEWLNNR